MSLRFIHVYSCCRRTLRNLRTHCSTVSLSFITITWQRIFKGSLQVAIIIEFFSMWLLTSLASDAARQWQVIMVRNVVLYRVKRTRGESVEMFPLHKFKKSIKAWDCECDQCVWLNSFVKLRLCSFFSRNMKLRGLLEIPL